MKTKIDKEKLLAQVEERFQAWVKEERELLAKGMKARAETASDIAGHFSFMKHYIKGRAF